MPLEFMDRVGMAVLKLSQPLADGIIGHAARRELEGMSIVELAPCYSVERGSPNFIRSLTLRRLAPDLRAHLRSLGGSETAGKPSFRDT